MIKFSSSFLFRLAMALTLLAQVPTRAIAQNPPPSAKAATSLEGTVIDTTGAVVVGALVSLKDANGGATQVQTDATGKYRFAALPAGPTEVLVTAPGFATFKSEGFGVNSGEPNVFDVQLQPAVAATQVNVVGGQKITEVETENAEVSGTITQQELVSYGLNGRNFATLIALAPGVSNQTGQDEAKVGVVGSAKYSVNGGRTEYNTFNVDGNDVLNPDIAASHGHATLLVYPSVDSIQELKVLTSNYNALYGRSASGTVLATIKSGAAEFHGNAYEFLRNEAFNARNYFDAPGKAPLYRRNDFGGTVGGPLLIPHVYNENKQKTFFFFSEEVRKERSPYEFNAAVPSLEERGYNLVTKSYAAKADFADVCPEIPAGGSIVAFSQVKYPDCPGKGTGTNRQTFIGNRFVIDPTAAALLQSGAIPMPTPGSTQCNGVLASGVHAPCYVAAVSLPTDFRQELLKIDHSITANEKLTLSAVHDHWQNTTAIPQWPNQPNTFPTIMNRFLGPGATAQAHLTSVLSTTLLNDLFFGATLQRVKLFDVPGPGASLSRAALDSSPYPMGFLFNNGFAGKLPAVVIGGNNSAYGGAGFTIDTSYEPWYHGRGTISIGDNVTKVIGKHNLQFGFQWEKAIRHEVNAANGPNTGDLQGVLTYKNVGSYLSTGNAFADFLYGGESTPTPNAGNIQSFQQDNTQTTYRVRYWLAEPYIQDDWHMTSKLVLNLGLRMSLFPNWEPENQTLYNFVPAAYDPKLAASSNVSVNSLHGYLQDASIGTPTSGNPIALNSQTLNPVLVNGLVQCGKGYVPSSCQISHLVNPAPRVGFSWDPLGKGQTVLRAGYGIFFEHGTGSEANVGSLIGNPPQILSVQEDYPGSAYDIGFYNSSRRSGTVAYPLNLVSIPTKTQWPYAQQWSIGLQQQISRNTAIAASYVGSKGTHLALAMQLNQLPPTLANKNPFGPGQPLTAALCQMNQTTPGALSGYFPGIAGANGSTVTLYGAASPVSAADPTAVVDPAIFLNMIAACDGTPGSSRPAISFSLNVLRPYQGLGSITSIQNVASSVYHSFQFTTRHNSGPLDLAVSYTYGHSIDSASDRYESNFVDAYDLAANRASSDFDQRHLLNVSYVYQLPLLRWLERFTTFVNCTRNDASNPACAGNTWSFSGPSKIVQVLLRDWSVSGITTYQSGTPFNVVNGTSNTGISVIDNGGLALGLSADSYPDRLSYALCPRNIASAQGTFGPLLGNACQFVAPRGLTQGNAGRNALNNPGRTNFDVALLRNIKTWHEMDLQFRAEAFNVFNHTQFILYDPNRGNTGSNTISCYGDASTGYSAGATSCLAGNAFLHPVAAHRPRTLQFGMKLSF